MMSTKDGGRANRIVARLLHPQMSDCIVAWVLLGLCFGMAMAIRIKAYDLFWHLETGRLIVATHAIPRVDAYSFTAYGKPWVTHEWLSAVVFWLVYSKAGFAGLSLLRAVTVSLTFALIFVVARQRTNNVKASAAATAISVLISAPFWLVRPQLFGYLCLAVLILLVHRFRRGASVWPVVPLFALWINLHGSWLMGAALLVWTGVQLGWNAVRDGEKGRILSYGGVLPFVVAALLLNPSPLAFVAYPFQYLGLTHHTQYIQEWQSPDFHKPEYLVFLFTLLCMGLVVRASKAKIDAFELVLILGLAGASLFSRRHLPVFALLFAPFMAEQIAGLNWTRARAAAPRDRAERALLNWALLLAIPLLIVAVLPRGGPTPYLDVSMHPTRAFDYLSNAGTSGKLLTEYGWGGYAIFRLWPKYRVYVDGRADLYGPGVMNRLSVLKHLKPGWRDELRRTRPDVIVWPLEQPLTQALSLSPEWRRVRPHPEDKVAAVFVPAKRGK